MRTISQSQAVVQYVAPRAELDNPRMIGILEEEVLRPVFLFNFLITGYISGPSDINYRG